MESNKDNRDILKWKRLIDSIQSNEQSVDEPMSEGTWAIPETPEQVVKLKNLLKNPLDADTALNELGDVFGDDELFDTLEDIKENEPETDVRHVVISRLKDMNFIKEVREHNQSNEESVAEDQGQADRYHNETLGLLIKKLHRIHDGIDNGYTTETIQQTLKLVMTELENLKSAFSNKAYSESTVEVDNAGNIAGYLDTIDEYVEMLFTDLPKNKYGQIAYRIQNAVDDIRTRELGLKPSNIRSQHESDESVERKPSGLVTRYRNGSNTRT